MRGKKEPTSFKNNEPSDNCTAATPESEMKAKFDFIDWFDRNLKLGVFVLCLIAIPIGIAIGNHIW